MALPEIRRTLRRLGDVGSTLNPRRFAVVDQIFNSIGADVLIDRDARFFRPENIRIGNNVRIDAQVVISAGHPVTIGDHVHLSVGSRIFASGGPVHMGDFSGLSSDVKIYTATDDYVGGTLTNPTVPDRFRDVATGPVIIGRHVVVGAGTVILPGVTLHEGSAVGALSLVRADVPEGAVVAGIPARVVTRRDVDRLRALERDLRAGEARATGGPA
jgi:acetyltransferase-like isoleucine patch superfamily enzyme